MKHIVDFNILRMSKFWATAALGLSMALLAPSHAQSNPLQCSSIFHENADLLIGMKPEYRGEDQGLYIDPTFKRPWFVKYFTNAERSAFEIMLTDGVFRHVNGKTVKSEFDPEPMSFNDSLIVIDKDFRFFLMPFEERGKYHHSSLSRSEDIIFAGTAAFHNGVLRQISNSSGHYKPSALHTKKILLELQKRGVDFSKVSLKDQAAKDLVGTFVATPAQVQKLLAE